MSIAPGRLDVRVLLDWLEGRLDTDQAEWVAAQVAETDELILRTVDWLRGFLGTARELPLEEPPPIVRLRLRQYFAYWSRAQAALWHKPRVAESRFGARRALTAGRPAAEDAIDLGHTA